MTKVAQQQAKITKAQMQEQPPQPQQNQEQMSQQKPLLLQIDAQIVEGIFKVLSQLPYGQVEPLMTALRTDLAKNNPQ